MSGLKIFADLMSQPSRAVLMFAKATNIPHEFQRVDIKKGEHMQDEYRKINKLGKLPAIVHNDFNLTESVAILRYLSRTYPVADHWYPKDGKQQARVDEFLEWQHIGLRLPLSMFFQTKFVQPLISGNPPKESLVELWKSKMIEALDCVEELWLNDQPFVGGNKISIADLLGACEIEQPRMAGFDPKEGRPKLTAWLKRVQTELHPHYSETHNIVNMVVKKFGGKAPTDVSKL